MSVSIPAGPGGGENWRAVANDFQQAMFEREAVIDQMKQAISFLQCCCRSGEHAGADHPLVHHALGAANTRKPKSFREESMPDARLLPTHKRTSDE